jgi:flagellar hook assembly protein FlgD
VLGREIRNYDLTAERSGGRTEVTWNGTDATGAPVNSGVYFVVYRSAAGTQTLKLMMLN